MYNTSTQLRVLQSFRGYVLHRFPLWFISTCLKLTSEREICSHVLRYYFGY